jgi:hypothetical protein
MQAREDMRLLLREELDWRFSDIAADTVKDLSAFGSLIEYSEEKGSVVHLVLAALRRNPGNTKLDQFIQAWIQRQLKHLSDIADVKSILSDPDLTERLSKICSARGWDEFYQRHVEYLSDEACMLVYTQTLTLQLWVEFPEIKMSLLAIPQSFDDTDRSKTAHLMLVLQAHGAEGKQMRIMSSLWAGRSPQDAIESFTKTQEQGVLCVNRMKVIAQEVARLIEQAENTLDEDYRFAGNVAIHFFVETKDLNYDWDQLGVDKDRVGIIYPVLVRAIERYQKKRYRRLLRQSWQQVQQNPDEAFTCCLDSHEAVPNDGAKAMLGVHWKGQFKGKRESQKAFERVLKGGVPLSIWLRCKSEDIASAETVMEEAVQALLTGHAIHTSDSWFGKVRHIRANSPILGKHLAVWWDDPDLCPVLPGFGEAQAGKSA